MVGLAMAAGAAAVAVWTPRGTVADRAAERPTALARLGVFEQWSLYDGRLAARRVAAISSHFNGGATIVELAPEGTRVQPGDRVVRFDSFQVETELARADREYAVAASALRALEQAILPMEARELEIQIEQARREAEEESATLEAAAALVREGLIGADEIARQEQRAAAARARWDHLKWRARLTAEHAHPARLDEARARAAAAERERDLLRDQLARCVVTAPVAGELVYLPIPFAGEIRPVRIGDTVFKNQEFLCIPDPSEWVVRFDVPEHELARVPAGAMAVLTPRAWPSLSLTGTVENVSAMAQTQPGAPDRRVFPATVRVHGAAPELRSGLTVRVAILSHREPSALMIPRSALRWEDGRPYCRRRAGGAVERRHLVLGPANEEVAVVRDGLAEGDQIEW